MSGVFRAIGKVFKPVVKVLKKIAIPALMIGAVVLTGGAALGALPALGTMVGSLGLSAGLTTALTGAISMGAVGAVTGGGIAALTGKNIMKGATGGFLAGAATGGLLGAAGALPANGLLGGGKAVATAAASNLSGLTSVAPSFESAIAPVTSTTGLLGSAASQLSSVAPSFASAVAPTVASAAAPIAASLAPVAASGGGILSSATAPLIMQTVGSAVSGLGQGMAASQQAKDAATTQRLEYDRTAYNYGYKNNYQTDKKGNVAKGAMPISQTRAYAYHPIDYSQPGGWLGQAGSPAGYYAIQGNQVVFVPASG